MKKTKLISTVLILALAVMLCFGFAACNDEQQNESYYNNTYTLSGTCTVDWDSKYYYDNYEPDYSKNYSQKEIIEKHWESISWDRTFEAAGLNGNDVPHSTFDEFRSCFEDYEEYFYEQVADLKFSFSGKDNLELTISFPSNWTEQEALSDHYESEITMPFYESAEQFAQNKPYENFDLTTVAFEAGYSGVGVYKTQDNHVLVVEFTLQKYINDINVKITDYTITADGNDTADEPALLFETVYTVLYLYDANGNSILDIRNQIDFEVAKNK